MREDVTDVGSSLLRYILRIGRRFEKGADFCAYGAEKPSWQGTPVAVYTARQLPRLGRRGRADSAGSIVDCRSKEKIRNPDPLRTGSQRSIGNDSVRTGSPSIVC